MIVLFHPNKHLQKERIVSPGVQRVRELGETFQKSLNFKKETCISFYNVFNKYSQWIKHFLKNIKKSSYY